MSNQPYGSADWMKQDEARALGLLDGPGLRFGIMASNGAYCRYGGDGHALIVAPPGAGKGIGFVVPNLVLYDGSMVVIDPKGENANQTALYRRETLGQKVYVLDPSGVTNLPSASFNPLSWLKRSTRDDFMADAIEFSQAVVENSPGKEHYWAECGQRLFRSLVFYLAGHDPDNLNLNALYRLAQWPLPRFLGLMKTMETSNCTSPQLREWIRESGAWYLGQTDDHQKFHLGTLQQAIAWMGNRGAQRIMGKSDFDFRDIKREGTTVYLCIHPLQLGAYRGWFRLVISQAIKGVFEPIGKPVVRLAAPSAPSRSSPLKPMPLGRRPSAYSIDYRFGAIGSSRSFNTLASQAPEGKMVERPVVFMLDEYARAVGRLAAIDNAIPQARGYGGRFAFVLQSIGQARDLYKEGWTAFEESCALQIFMQARGETAEHISKRSGVTTKISQSSSGFSKIGQPLWFPNDVSGRPPTDVIAFVNGKGPLVLNRITSYTDTNIAPHIDLNTMESKLAGPATSPSNDKSRPLLDEVKPLPADSADAKEAKLLLMLSDIHDKPVFKNTDGRFGYRDEFGMFVEVETKI